MRKFDAVVVWKGVQYVNNIPRVREETGRNAVLERLGYSCKEIKAMRTGELSKLVFADQDAR